MREEEKESGAITQSLESLGLFAGGIAHDFNNILSIIDGHARTALRQLESGTLSAEQLQKIAATAQRGADLTRRLLAFARQRVDTGETTLLCDALRQQQVILQPILGPAVRLDMALPECELRVRASADQIMQLFMNLTLNARDAMPGGGAITVTCGTEGAFASLTFADTGHGIPESVMPRIFEPFFTTKTLDKGTGLGLSVVYGIVSQLGGRIEAFSKPGAGATFRVLLPLAEAPAGTQPGAQTSLDGKTILVAEDEPELKDILAMMLDGMNMKVLTASNGNHALRMLADHVGVVDFLLTDIVMPEMDGIRLAGHFSEKYPESNVVYMSGYPFLDGGRNFNLPGDADFIDKPLGEDRLKQILQRALERKKAREEEGAE